VTVDSCKKTLLHLACSGLFITGICASVLPLAAQQAAGTEHDSLASNSTMTASVGKPVDISELPDSPGATVAKAAETQQNTQPANGNPSPSSPAAQKSSGSRAQSISQTPVGTAVAESPNASGVAASQPAGVAIAPAKQRRVRTIVLRMGALVGAGVAVGSVVALTAGTSSKPPGAH
jgi:hypothetical protein